MQLCWVFANQVTYGCVRGKTFVDLLLAFIIRRSCYHAQPQKFPSLNVTVCHIRTILNTSLQLEEFIDTV